MYKCEYCGKEFDNCHKLGGHKIHCEKNPNSGRAKEQLAEARKKAYSVTKENLHLHCKYCGKEIANNGCLVLHERHCKENPNRIECKGNYGKTKGHPCPFKGETKLTNESLKRKGETYHDNYKAGKFKASFDGKKHTPESKEKMRLQAIQYIEQLKGPFRTRYSIKGCRYIDKLNENNNWHLQHAENGGEIEVGGYFLDGYDKELNIVFEYDEPKHYKDVINNVLTERDIERQNFIIEMLDCQFYRYNEYLDYFYKVN